MRSLITCAFIALSLQQILANEELFLEDSLFKDFANSSSFSPPPDSSDSSYLSSFSSSESSLRNSNDDSLDDPSPSAPCPPGKSLHAKEDVQAMIDDTARTLLILRSIHNSYNSQALAVFEKHTDDFEQFRNWFHNYPEHLRHVLEDLARRRVNINPSVKKVAYIMCNNYSSLEQNFIKRIDRTNSLITNIISYRNMYKDCKYRPLGNIRTSYGQDNICSSLEDLHRDINSELMLFKTKMTMIMQQQVKHDDKVFAEKIDVLKNKLKDVALKKFGRTMYDILHLEDEYHHFIKDITKINPMSYVNHIKDTIIRIDIKLFEFEKLIEKYVYYCKKCRKSDVCPLPQNVGVVFRHEERINTNILDHLLNQKFTEIESSINKDYAIVFQELNSLLDNTVIEELFSIELQPIHSDVTRMLQSERFEFNQLKKCAPRISIIKLINLLESSQKLLSNIGEEIDNLKRSFIKTQ